MGSPCAPAGAAVALAPSQRALPAHSCSLYFFADFWAAALLLCDPISCCMDCERAVKKIRGQGEKERLLCATPMVPTLSVTNPESPSAFHTPLPLSQTEGGCRGLATGARGRSGRSHVVPTCAPSPQLQSDFSVDFCAAVLMLCDPELCCMTRKRVMKKIRGQGDKGRMLCPTP